MKCATKLGILAAAFVLVLGQANAKEMGGKWGVGLHQNIGGASGLGMKYWTGKFGIIGNLGFHVWSPEEGDSTSIFLLGLGGIYNLVETPEANLGIGGIVNLALRSRGESSFHALIEIPLVAEYFLSDHFSIFGQVGIVFSFVPEEGSVVGPELADGFGFSLGAGTEATAGFTFYF